MRVNASGIKSMDVRLPEGALVSDVMDAVCLEWGVPTKYQRLLYRGRLLRPNQHVSDLQIGDEDEVVLQATLKGGCLTCPTGHGGTCTCGGCTVM